MTSPAEFAAQVCADDHDPLRAYDLEDAALYASAHGTVSLDARHLPLGWQRSLSALIERSPSTATGLAAFGDVLMLVPAIRDEFRSAHGLAQWWGEAGVFASRYIAAEIAPRLHALARWRELRAFGIEVARAAEAQDAHAIIAAMRGVARLLREMGALAEARAAA